MTLEKLTVDVSGPLFTHDVKKTLYGNIRTMLEGLAAEGEDTVRSAWPRKTGHGAEGTIGRVQSLSGKRWMLHAVISAQYVYPWGTHGGRGFAGRGEAQYRGGKAEARYHMFRRTAQAMRQSAKILGADLAKDLN